MTSSPTFTVEEEVLGQYGNGTYFVKYVAGSVIPHAEAVAEGLVKASKPKAEPKKAEPKPKSAPKSAPKSEKE